MANPVLSSLVPTVWQNNVAIYTWTALGQNTPGPAINGPGWTDRSFQATGTFGAGGQAICQGSNDGINWFTLHDPFSNPITFGGPSGGLAEVTEICLFMRPSISGGDGSTNITVVMVCCNHNPN